MARNSSPKSIHDADATAAKRTPRTRSQKASRTRRLRKVAALCLGAVGVTGLGYSIWTTMGGPVGPSELSQAPSQEQQFVDVLIDGWSLRTLEGRPVTVEVGTRAAQGVRFEPVTAADLFELLATSPELVQAALARQITDASDLTCDSTSCSAAGEDVDVNELLLGSGSDAAMLLRSHGVESGLLKARVEVPAGVSTVELTAEGYSPLTLSVVPVVGGDDPDAAADGPALVNGFQRGRWMVSAGLGRLFTPDAAWLGEEGRAAVPMDMVGSLPQDAVARLTAAAVDVSATTGLAAPLPAAQSWTVSQLTIATSPTQGCSAGVLCYPGELAVTETVTAPQYVTVSSEQGTGVVVIDDRVAHVTLPAPIRQAGIDQRLSGTVDVRFLTTALHGGAGLTPVDWAGLVDLTDREVYTPAEVLTNVQLAGKTWTVTS